MKIVRTETPQKNIIRKYPVVVVFRCTEEDREIIRRRAYETGNSVSAYLRKRAIGGQTSKPIQDFKDVNQLKQHLGLLKSLVLEKRDVRPILKTLEILISKMTDRAG